MTRAGTIIANSTSDDLAALEARAQEGLANLYGEGKACVCGKPVRRIAIPEGYIVPPGVSTMNAPDCAECHTRKTQAKRDNAAREAEAERTRIRVYREANLPDLLTKAGANLNEFRCWRERGEVPGFKNFDPNPDGEARVMAHDVLRAFRSGKRPRPRLYLFSRRPGMRIAPGAGKSHLAHAIAAGALLDPDVPESAVRIVYVPALLDTIRDATFGRGSKTARAYLMELTEPDLLIWDDIGVGTFTEWTVETLTKLMHFRAGKSDVFTSNESPDGLRKESKTQAIERVVSRLLEDCRVVKLNGPDRRVAAAS